MRKQQTKTYSEFFANGSVIRAKRYIHSKDLTNQDKIDRDIAQIKKTSIETFKNQNPGQEWEEWEGYLDEYFPTRKLKSYRDCFESCWFVYEIRGRE